MEQQSAGRPVTDVRALKALAHPLRMRLLHALSASGSATVSQLASAVGQSPALVSYHLRQLAAYDFIEEAPGHARDGREHAYRRTPGGISWSASDFADQPGGKDIAAAAMNINIGQQLARLTTWQGASDQWPSEWVDAALMTDTMLTLTSAELTELNGELLALVERYRSSGAAAATTQPAGREAVFVFIHAFPTTP